MPPVLTTLCLALASAVMGAQSVTPPTPLERHHQSARVALAKGDIERATRELKLSIQDNPIHAESHFLLASLLAREGELDQAIVGFQRTVAVEPNNAAALYNLGTALLWRGEVIAAAQLLEDAILIRADHVSSYINLGKAYFLAGVPELAVASYQEALRRDPTHSLAQQNLNLLLTAAGAPSAIGTGDATEYSASEAGRQEAVAPASKAGAPGGEARASGPTTVPDVDIPEAEARDDAEADALRELLRDLEHVTVERRGGQLAVVGWTSGTNEATLLERILAGRSNVLNLTSEDVGDPQRLLEVDAIIFKVIGIDSESAGHNFLRRIEVNASLADAAMGGFTWMYSAAISYDVNIANALNERIAFLARPHLTTLSGTPATFIAGGDIVYRVTGNIGGDIKPYPFGTTLDVTLTLLRTRDKQGGPLIRVVVRAGCRSLLPIADIAGAEEGSTVFENLQVTSEAVLGLNQTLILTGLSQRETRTIRSGVPVLRSIPVLKYLFSESSTTTSDLALIILLTPRDPAYWDEQRERSLTDFVAKRRAYIQAKQGTEEDTRRFKERYPEWNEIAPNRFASHFFLMDNSELYRRVSGTDLSTDALEFDLLGSSPKKKAKR